MYRHLTVSVDRARKHSLLEVRATEGYWYKYITILLMLVKTSRVGVVVLNLESMGEHELGWSV